MSEPDTFSPPRSPLPPPVMVSEAGSFARHTIEHRLAPIVERAIAENDFPPAIVERLETLAREIPDAPIRPLTDDGGPDSGDWAVYLRPFQGKNWLDLPFYFAESYFYRRLLWETNYFGPGAGRGIDPFARQKTRGLEVSRGAIRSIARQTDTSATPPDLRRDGTGLTKLLHLSLWGNRADLSLWPVDSIDDNPSQITLDRESADLLVDDTPRLAEAIADFSGERLDFILDNAGFELVCDLCSIDFLLSAQIAETVYLHLKAHPTFVSDALTKDVLYTLEVLSEDPDAPVRALAHRLRDYRNRGRLICREDFFWTSPLPFSEMPDSLRRELALSRLVFIKGDANYRRLLGERHWPFTTPLGAIAGYFPAPFVALRTLKSQGVAGLRSPQVETLNREDPRWLIEGRKGVIQFLTPSR